MSLLAWIGVALGVLALAALATYLHYLFWVRRFSLQLEYERVEKIPTGDGGSVVLRRLPRSAATDVRGPPVLLVHGLALNHRNHDMTEDLSLGRYLARAGRDVWLLTLRSGREDLSFREERRVTFGAMAEHDLPAGVRAVLERTHAEHLDYVGFSMGGMLLYASLGVHLPPALLRKVVIIGSPATIEPPFAALAAVARLVPSWIVPTLRLRVVSSLVAFASELVRTPIHHWIYNPENVDRGLAAFSLVNGFVDIPGKLAAQFVAWSGAGGAVRHAGEEVTRSLRGVSTPVLFLAGAADRLAPPRAVRLAHDAWGADVSGVDKTFCIVGIAQGAAADYGHGDLAIGRHAELDVFEPVEEWLAG